MFSQLTGVLIPRARPLSITQSISVIEQNRAPTGTNRPFRSRFGAVLDARVILNAGGLHFPTLLSSPTNSPRRTPGTAFLSRIARGSITQAIFCDPQLPMSILKKNNWNTTCHRRTPIVHALTHCDALLRTDAMRGPLAIRLRLAAPDRSSIALLALLHSI